MNAQRGGVAFNVLATIFGIGVASLGLAVSGAVAKPDIALFTVSWLFLMGISQAGVVFTAILRISNADWGKPWYRLAELSTLAYFPFAIIGFILIVAFGRDDLFYWLQAAPEDHISSWLNINWLVARNLAGLLLFYGVAFVYARKSLRVDMAGTDAASPIDQDEVRDQMYFLSPVVLIVFVLCNTFLSWDLAMMLTPHFHSTVFPIHFWFGNVFAGTSAVIAIAAVMRFVDGGAHFGLVQIKSLGMLVTGFTLLWLYFYWAQFFVIWFGNLPQEIGPLFRQMDGHYAPYFWTMLVCTFMLPFVASIFAIFKRSVFATCVIAISINLGIWINKYLMIVPVFSLDDQPFDQWIDIALALGLLAGFLATITLLARRLPVYSTWEMNR